jgi:S-adenosylmethionine hydrolase
MRPPRTSKTSVLTLTTDFGLTDAYVAEMKAVLLRHAPTSPIVDITHQIPPQDVISASVTLERALRTFPAGTIHLAVVDPGVGTARRLLLCEVKNQTILCPDNGLITWPWRRHPNLARAYELVWPGGDSASSTFHGRDLLAPAAGMLASGQMFLSDVARPIDDPVLLDDLTPAGAPARRARVIHIDHFGNAATNATADALKFPKPRFIKIAGHKIPVHQTYADVKEGKPLALIGSSGLLEIALRNGDAAKTLKLKIGTPLTIDLDE